MKITKEQLKQIIKEELIEVDRLPVPINDPFGPEKTKEIKSHLRALKRIFDEVGLKSVPDEMKRGWSKMRGALETIPGLNEEQEGSFLQISISDDGYDKDIEQISNPDEVDVDVSKNPYVAYRAVVKVIKSSGEL
jgi:hypothetical protein